MVGIQGAQGSGPMLGGPWFQPSIGVGFRVFEVYGFKVET